MMKQFYSWMHSAIIDGIPTVVCQNSIVMGLNGCASGADDLYIIEVYAI